MAEEIHHIFRNAQKPESLIDQMNDLKTSDVEAATVVLRNGDDADSKNFAKRRHDILASLRTLTLTKDAIRDGYQFDDAMAPAKIRAVERAVQIITRESRYLLELLPKK